MRQTTSGALPRQRKPILAAAIAGSQGAMLLFILQLTLHALDISALPLSVVGAQKTLHLTGIAVLPLAFALAGLGGLVWGACYGALVPRFTMGTGILFGLAPWLCAVLFVLPLSGRFTPAGADFRGIFLSLIQLTLWGAFVGYRMSGKTVG